MGNGFAAGIWGLHRPTRRLSDGQITPGYGSSPSQKNKSLAPSGKSVVQLPPSCPTRATVLK